MRHEDRTVTGAGCGRVQTQGYRAAEQARRRCNVPVPIVRDLGQRRPLTVGVGLAVYPDDPVICRVMVNSLV